MSLAKTYSGKIGIQLSGDYPKAVGTLSLGDMPAAYNKFFSILNGTGAGKANAIFMQTFTIAPSGSPNSHDLNGVLTDVYGDVINFTKVKALLVAAAAANADNVLVGGAASDAASAFFGDPSDILVVHPGGLILLIATDGYIIIPSTADILKIADAAAAGVTYDLLVIGESS
jgi:hypothetical protein